MEYSYEDITVKDALSYRTYYGTAAVVMDIPRNRFYILEDDALGAWKKITAGEKGPVMAEEKAVIESLHSNGIVRVGPLPKDTVKTVDEDRDGLGLEVLHLWAFRNHIPISGHFELTETCNHRCRHCYCIHKGSGPLDTADVVSILEGMKASGVMGLVLTGGEIFCRPDIYEILDAVEEMKFAVRLNTNGTLIDEGAVKRLGRYNSIYRIHVSLYSGLPEVHEGITGRPGSFDETVTAVRRLHDVGIGVRINCCVMNSNLSSYRGVKYDIADPLGLPVRYDPMIVPMDDGSSANMIEKLGEKDLRDFYEWKAQEKLGGFDFDHSEKRKLCKAGFSFFAVTASGDLYPCLKMKRVYDGSPGNCTEKSFGEIWEHSKMLNRVRSRMLDSLSECEICDVKI